MPFRSKTYLPVEVVFAPAWWNKRCGIKFDKGFYVDPVRRVKDEQTKRRMLAQIFGDLALGEKDPEPRPVIGPVHLAAGYLVQEALGCQLVFHEDAPPDVIPQNLDDQAFEQWEPPQWFSTPLAAESRRMIDALKSEYGYVEGDINWSGILNLLLDVRGNALYMDLYDRPQTVQRAADKMADFLLSFVQYIDAVSTSTSISVNRTVRHVDPGIHLTSNCTVTMLSAEAYEQFLLEPDQKLADSLKPFGIHHCGNNMEKFAASYGKIDGVVFFDVGWGSDVKACRETLPEAFLNLRLCPVTLARCSPAEIVADVNRLAAESRNLDQTGFCCINLDDTVPDENIRALFHAVERLRPKQRG